MQVLCVCQMLRTNRTGDQTLCGQGKERVRRRGECPQGLMGCPAGLQVLLLPHPNPTKITWIVESVEIAGTITHSSSRTGWRSGRRHARTHTLAVRLLLLL